MAGRVKMWRSVALAALAWSLAGAPLHAQSAPAGDKGSAGMNGKVIGAGSGSAAGDPSTVVDPSNGGVADTGMGMGSSKDNVGKGMSVKGPSGKGISNSTDTGQ